MEDLKLLGGRGQYSCDEMIVEKTTKDVIAITLAKEAEPLSSEDKRIMSDDVLFHMAPKKMKRYNDIHVKYDVYALSML